MGRYFDKNHAPTAAEVLEQYSDKWQLYKVTGPGANRPGR